MASEGQVGSAQPLAQVPRAKDLAGNPFLPPKDGRCPINELPPELLAHIFMLGTAEFDTPPTEDDEEEDEEDEDEDHDEDDNDFQILVSHVCHVWREVALDTPALWTRIDFHEGPPFIQSSVYLQRAKNAPLEISVDVTREEEEEEEDAESDNTESDHLAFVVCKEEIEAIMELIIPHAYHWRSLDISVSDYVLMHYALVTMSECPAAPILEVLQLYHYEETDEYEEFSPSKHKEQDFILFHGNAPRLKHVALWGVHLNWTQSHFLSGLVDFELAYHAKDVRPAFKDFARILHESPNIDILTICQSGPLGGPVDWLSSVSNQRPQDVARDALNASAATPSSITTVSLPSVKSLVFAFLEPDYAQALIQRLALPNLTSLAIDFEHVDCSTLLRTLARPSPATGKSLLVGLEALKVSGLPCEDKDAVFDAYACMCNLRSLNLNFGYIAEAWYDLLAREPPAAGSSSSAQQMILLPRLDALTTTGLEGERVRTLVQTRKALGLPLKCVFINEDDDLNEDDEKWLSDNVDEFQYFEGSDEEDYIVEDVVEMDFDEAQGGAHGEDDDGWVDVD